MNLRWETADAGMNAIDVVPGIDNLGIADARIIAPGDPRRSILVQRMMRRDHFYQMPPLATSRADDDGSTLLIQWVVSLLNGVPAYWLFSE